MKYQDNSIKLRPSVQQIEFSPTLAINEQVKAARLDGVNILHMGFGESPFPVHPEICEALAVNASRNMYLPTSGLPELCSLAGTYFGKRFGFNPNDFNVIIGPGSKELIFDIQLAVEGDTLIPVPSWVSYIPQSILIGDQVIPISTTLKDDYHVTAENLEIAVLSARRDGKNPVKLILNYPNNPSGLTMNPSRLDQITQVCRKYNLLVISDEIYGLINHQGKHTSIASFYPEDTIITTGLSKHLSLGGYRLGVAMIPKKLPSIFNAVSRIASETWSCVSSPIQYSAVKAFEEIPEIENYIQTCTQIHRLVSEYVRDSIVNFGIHYPTLGGGFYLYPDFGKYRIGLQENSIGTSDDLAKDLLNKIRVATLPGTAFGDPPEHLRLRLAMCDFDGQSALDYILVNPTCSSTEIVNDCCPNIKLACEKITGYFENLNFYL